MSRETPPAPEPKPDDEPGTPDTGDTPDVDVDVTVDNGDQEEVVEDDDPEETPE